MSCVEAKLGRPQYRVLLISASHADWEMILPTLCDSACHDKPKLSTLEENESDESKTVARKRAHS